MEDDTFLEDRHRRTVLAGALAMAATAALASCMRDGAGRYAPTPALRLLAQARWPHRLAVDGVPAGGLSAIDRDAATGDLLLLCDDRGELAPVRFLTARWPDPSVAAPTPGRAVFLQPPGGGSWPSRRTPSASLPVPDPEALRLHPSTGTVLWTSEGDHARGFGPTLYESTRDGRFLREYRMPAMFVPDPARRTGPRDNLGFEGLAITPDGRHAWLAMENALLQDGPEPTVDTPGGPCRLTQIDLDSGACVRQIAYVPDAIPQRPLVPGTFADNGVSEVLLLDDHRLLVLERAYATGVGNSLRLYEIDTRTGDDVRALETLTAANHRSAPKTRVADFATLGLSHIDNGEGLCWGPPLPNGNRMLLLVSDDNFNPLQVTQFAAFEFIDRP